MAPWAALVVPATLDLRAIERLQTLALGAPQFIRPWGDRGPWGALFAVHELDNNVLEELFECLVGLNLDFLRDHPEAPALYDAGVVYRPEAPYQEEWLTIPWAMQRSRDGYAVDCEDLAAWRVAELRHRGEHARAVWTWQRSRVWDGAGWDDHDNVHVRVRRADGSIEDPSALSGMGRYGGN